MKSFNKSLLKRKALSMRKTMIKMGFNCGTSAHFGGGFQWLKF